MQPRAELRALVERAQETERVHLAGEDGEEEVEVGLSEGGGAVDAVRVANGEDDGGSEHADCRERGGFPGYGDDVGERAVEVVEACAGAPEGAGDCG